MSIAMKDENGITWLQSTNLQRLDCDWCFSPALYSIGKLSTRDDTPQGRTWVDHCCTHHRDKWFPVNPVVNLVRECRTIGFTAPARRFIVGPLADVPDYGITACVTHQGDGWSRMAHYVVPRSWFAQAAR